MKASQTQLDFSNLSEQVGSNNKEELCKIDLLACQFKASKDHCNREIYFDPLIKQS